MSHSIATKTFVLSCDVKIAQRKNATMCLVGKCSLLQKVPLVSGSHGHFVTF